MIENPAPIESSNVLQHELLLQDIAMATNLEDFEAWTLSMANNHNGYLPLSPITPEADDMFLSVENEDAPVLMLCLWHLIGHQLATG